MKFIYNIGSNTIKYYNRLSAFLSFTFHAIKAVLTPRWYSAAIHKQIIEIGFYSLPVVGLTAIFTGAVLALQTYAGTSFGQEITVPTVVALGITRELGPVLVGLMVTGRIAASIAAEIGTMKVTEQIDALRTLSTNPFRYLIAPRIIASTLTLPMLVLIADIIGILGGSLAATFSLKFDFINYLVKTVNFLKINDISSGLIKSTVFGFIIALLGSFHGYNSKAGAEGVGMATTNAVVSASILILLFNYLLTDIFFI